LDESGDHGLKHFDPNYPVFVLAAVLLRDPALGQLEKTFSGLKQVYFGNGDIIFHEREIRKREGPFGELEKDKYVRFVEDLTHTIDQLDFQVIAVIIDKRRLVTRYVRPDNPYEIALGFVIERIAMEVRECYDGELPLILEGRGRREDRSLLRVFRDFREGRHPLSKPLRYGGEVLKCMRLKFRDKRENIAGLQLADLVARPLGIGYLRPEQRNRAVEVIREKLIKSPRGNVDGFGLKVFPQNEN